MAIYRFTISSSSGTKIRTYLPDTVSYEGNPDIEVEICRQYLYSYNVDLLNCFYSHADNMVEFDMPTNVMPGFFMYEIGELKNPPYS